MRKYIIFTMLGLLLLAACTEEELNNNEKKKLSAVISNPIEGAKSAFASGDEVKVFSDKDTKGGIFSAKDDGILEGESIEGDDLYAFYPNTMQGLSFDGNYISFQMPSDQKYTDGETLPSVYPLVASGSKKDGLTFKAVAALLKINLRGEGSIASVKIEGSDSNGNAMPMSGNATIDIDDSSLFLAMEPTANTYTAFNGALTAGLNTSCYLIVPAGNYARLTVTVLNAEGANVQKIFENVAPGLTSVTTLDVDVHYGSNINLSTAGLSNCYIIAAAGNYAFDTKLHDNTPLSGTAADYLWTDVEYIWTSEAENGVKEITGTVEPKNPEYIVKDVVYNTESKQITFTATGNVGNVVIALYNDNGGKRKIVWTWHIWVTGQTVSEMTVANWRSKMLSNKGQSLNWLDRNIGAFNITNVNNVGNYGLLYQWGRKDPFIGSRVTGSTANTTRMENTPFGEYTMPVLNNEAFDAPFSYNNTDLLTVAQTAGTPTTFYLNADKWASDIQKDAWGDGEAPFNDWQTYAKNTDPKENFSDGVRKGSKSNYDPCPQGYRVPTAEELWLSFATFGIDNKEYPDWNGNVTTVKSDQTQGRKIISFADPNTFTRIPTPGWRQEGALNSVGYFSIYWTSTTDPNPEKDGWGLRWVVASNLRIDGSGTVAIARPLRCVAE